MTGPPILTPQLADEHFTIAKLGTGRAEIELVANGDMTIAGNYLAASNRTAKETIAPGDPAAVLARIAQIPTEEWS